MMVTDMRNILALAMLTLSTIAVQAGPFEDGANAYQRGDYSRAINSWRSLASTNATIQNNYGVMYMDGKGVPRNYATAVTWFSRSAANGSSLGQNNLGGMYRDGRGVTRDYAKAITFFQASAGQGNPAAQNNLGLMLMNGQGVRPDPIHAYMWFDLAAAAGVQQSAANRSILRQHLSPAAVAQADQLANRCRAQGFKGCA
jgi:TPR repeat protein